MTNTISFWLGALVLGFFAYDYFVMDWFMTVYLGRKLLEFIEYLAFWR
ncbi:MAG: hypothetical protein GY717_01800 [Rhodobacteraceae bacterium]|nr:hypothetical protein [Paracoccaceae bacterium]